MSSMGDDSSFGGRGWQPPDSGELPPGRGATGQPAPPHDASRGAVVGEVRGFQSYSEQDPIDRQRQRTVWTFRVQRFDPAGNLLSQVPVEMRGGAFRGAVRDGDWVEVSGGAIRAGTRVVDRVLNKTTNSVVGAVRWRTPLWLVMLVVIGLVVVLAIFVVSALLIFNVWRNFPDPPEIPSGAAPWYGAVALDLRGD